MSLRFLGLLFVSLCFFFSFVHSKTDSQDVSALNGLYTSLNSPSKLKYWQANGGDPCGDSWTGIYCKGSSVTEIKVPDLGLSGSLGYQLANLKSVTHFDLSNNKLKGDMPYQLPPNLVHLDFSNNGFTGTPPYSISQMNDLQFLMLGHNQMNGEMSDMFQKLPKLDTMDLSFNKLSGNLPQSFANLTNLKTLYLQNNQLTGSINVLRNLALEDLNVENNKFSGWIPNELKDIGSIETGGNSWSTKRAPPPPPGAHYGSKGSRSNDSKSSVGGVVIIGSSVGVLLFLVVIIALFSRKRRANVSSHFIDEAPSQRQESSHEVRIDLSEDYKGHNTEDSTASAKLKSAQKPPSIKLKSSASSRVKNFSGALDSIKSTANLATEFQLSDLQTATANFATGRLLGEGTIGRVYRAKYPDGKVLAVKKIDSSLFEKGKVENITSVVGNISKIQHPSIAKLVGYCSEQGHNLLVFEYYRNGSIHEFLHLSDDFSKPLTWNTRIRIALGTARAIEYLHEVRSPSLVLKNIKSSNILLDAELNPHLSDYGLGIFYNKTSQNPGYNAPECTNCSTCTLKSDVYSFGVVMLELLSGRMPFDSNRPKSEQSLVEWATSQLHDIEALAKMVDPALRGLYPPKSLSRFADVIALCVQVEPEFRPPMSEVVESLVRLIESSTMSMKEELSSSRRTEDSDYY